MKKRTVIHLTQGLEVGGQEKLLVEFARHADRSRFHLHFVSLTNRGLLANEIENSGWPVTALEAPAGLRPSLVLALARLFRKLKADVVHTHDDRPNIHGAPAAFLARVKCLQTRHSSGMHLAGRRAVLMRASSLFNRYFVCIGTDSAQRAVKQGISRRRVVVLHNGIDTVRFAQTGPKTDGPAVLVARLAVEKDIATLLRAAALVREKYQDFQLMIAGDGPCREELETLAHSLQLAQSVQFLGTVTDIAGLLSRCRLFVLSSIREGISLTLLEAMARGLPVVATDVGGNPEVVALEQTGLLVPAQSPASMAEAIARLWKDPDMCSRMGAAGRCRVESLFDIKRMVFEYERLYLS